MQNDFYQRLGSELQKKAIVKKGGKTQLHLERQTDRDSERERERTGMAEMILDFLLLFG